MVVRSNTFTLYSAVTLSAADQASTSQLLDGFEEAVILINVTAVSGTSPTVDLDVEISDNEEDWYKLQDVPQITAVGKQAAVQVTNFGKYLRLNDPAVPGGSDTPTVTLSAVIVAKGR